MMRKVGSCRCWAIIALDLAVNLVDTQVAAYWQAVIMSQDEGAQRRGHDDLWVDALVVLAHEESLVWIPREVQELAQRLTVLP